jgi:hypothetical protein
MTTKINDIILPIPPASIDFSWSPTSNPIGITINGNTYPPSSDPRFAAYAAPVATPITFTATALVNPRAPIIEYKWTTGDGFIKFGQIITHQYKIANPHVEVTLETVDSLGRRRVVSHVLTLESTTSLVVDPNITSDSGSNNSATNYSSGTNYDSTTTY